MTFHAIDSLFKFNGSGQNMFTFKTKDYYYIMIF